MKKIIALIVVCTLIFTSCSPQSIENKSDVEIKYIDITEDENAEQYTNTTYYVENSSNFETQEMVFMDMERSDFDSLEDTDFKYYIEDTIYDDIISQLNSDEYFVENVEAKYISKEYLEELEYNSKENIFFGFTLSELEEQFQGTKYIFTLDDNGNTVFREFESYDDIYDQVVKNVIIGTGVILICVTVSIISDGASIPAISTIFAASAKSATGFALSSGVFSGVSAAVVKGIETKEFDEAVKAGIVEGSEEFKWGAIGGAIEGGLGETFALHRATANGLTMNEAARIQQESKLPIEIIGKLKSEKEYHLYKEKGLPNGLKLNEAVQIIKDSKLSFDVVKNIHSLDEYNIYKNAGLQAEKINGKYSLIQKINLDYVDKKGQTNRQRILNNQSPLDEDGIAYELHHIGQANDAPLAILTKDQHMKRGNNTILHWKKDSVVNHGHEWNKTVHDFWKNYLDAVDNGLFS